METVELAGSVKGEGPPLILLHGLFGAGDNLGGIRRRLEHAFEVHSLDLRNHGRSPHTKSMSYSVMAADVLAYMDATGLQEANVLGHSMGGKVAMEMALSHPQRVSRLIVADIAPVAYEAHHDGIREGLQQFDPTTVRSRREADKELTQWIDIQGVRQFLLTNLVPDEEKGGFQWRMNVPGILGSYEQIVGAQQSDGCFEGETLFVRGGDSDYIQESHREVVERLFPKAQLKVIPEAGHWLHAEKPELFARVCERFLTS